MSASQEPTLTIVDDISGPIDCASWGLPPLCSGLSISISKFEMACVAHGLKIEIVPAGSLFRSRTEVFSGDWCVISLETSKVVDWADFYVEATRAVADVFSYGSGPFVLAARMGSYSLNLQLDNAAEAIKAQHLGRRVALLDDGFGGGLTFELIQQGLHKRGIVVNAYAAAVNKLQVKSIGGLPVLDAGAARLTGPWMNARDVFWGAPHGGISLMGEDSVIGGIPHSLFRTQAALRLGLDNRGANAFRGAALQTSIDWWKSVEKAACVQVGVRDVPRLMNVFPSESGRLVDFIEEASVLSDAQLASRIAIRVQ